MPYEKPSSSDLVGIRTSKYKYFRSANDPKKNINLYDLENDPFENNNIANIYPDKVNELEKILTNMTSNSSHYTVDEISEEETKRIEQELRRLGYM